ncbi:MULTISPECIES: small multidrug efflux protein [unclassified Microbacterium]|uniref:small multidrug efflux protein n=1 Tax=unclassified Microbacterium TaxID=2609290 RepID=UPI000EA95134|nr:MULTISPECIES: small multidrug efflux protein [unclassified Microbacterium]MBT2484739.1 small multidrug efflux protein [Microbacterium sp. ISL-108]RKN67619.1 small multidrug efflux protein [Microbacterium sp. CGR2]
MNLIETFQNWVAQVPDLVQPLIVALAGAVPFIEGEGAATIGIIGGIPPVIAAIAAIIGNFVCVAVLVLASSGARKAIVTRTRANEPVLAGGGTTTQPVDAADIENDRKAARRGKFQRAFERYGVPGVSLLGPLLLPTQFTATMLAAAGVGKARILFWQGLAIIAWTTVFTVIITTAVNAVA